MLAGRARRLDRHQGGDEALPCRHAVIRAGRYIHPSIILRAIVNDRNKRTSCEGLLTAILAKDLSGLVTEDIFYSRNLIRIFPFGLVSVSRFHALLSSRRFTLSLLRNGSIKYTLIPAPHAATAGTMHCMRLPVAMDPMGALTTCSATSNVGYGIFLDQLRNNV
jgi:hypothetical protein